MEKPDKPAGTRRPLRMRDTLRLLGIRASCLILLKRIFRIHRVLILKLNLSGFQPRSFERIPGGELCLLTPEDIPPLLSAVPYLGGEDRRELLARVHFYNLGFTRLYAIRKDGEIACIQWLITPEDNPVIRTRYRRLFFELRPGQAMLENVFTFPKYRGLGYLPTLSQRLLVQAREMGFHAVIAYIPEDKITSLNEFVNMGFRFFNLLRIIQIFGFVRRKLLLPRV